MCVMVMALAVLHTKHHNYEGFGNAHSNISHFTNTVEMALKLQTNCNPPSQCVYIGDNEGKSVTNY